MVFMFRSAREALQTLLARAQLAQLDGRGLLVRSEGQGLIEYALIVSLIAIVAIGALSVTGTNVRAILNRVGGDV